jgi:fructuronate reductase
MWVIEDDKRAQLPAWHEVGALITNNVHDYELVKMRAVNGMQTALAHLGHLSNFKYMSDVLDNETLREFGRTLIMKEVLPNLPQVNGLEPEGYVNETVNRLANTAIGHRTAQISTDGSQKIRHRLLDPLYDAFKVGMPRDGLTIVVAAWLMHMFKLGGDADQKEISDPFLSVAIKVRGESENNLSYFIDELLKERTVFPQWVNEVPNLVGEFKAIAAQIQDQQMDKVLREYLSAHQR